MGGGFRTALCKVHRYIHLIERDKMAAVSDGNDKWLEDVDYDLQRHLKGVNTQTPELSTLAQKGDEKVMLV